MMQAGKSPGLLADGLRELLAPDKSRWKPMLAGLALFALGAGAAVFLRPAEYVALGLVMLALAAWVVGAFAMIGYVRWFFANELAQMKRDEEDDAGRKDR